MRGKKAKALWAMKAAWDRGKEHYDPARKADIFGRTKNRLYLWEEHLKDPIAALAKKALECLERHINSRGGCNGLQRCEAKILQKMWEGAILGRRLALPGSTGRCAFAHIIQLLECPGEVWATQRAFLLSHQERAGGSHEGSAVRALRLCRNAQGVCADCSAPFGSRR